MLGRIGLQARQRQRAGGLGHGAHVLEDVAHGGGDLVGGDGDDVVEQRRAQAEGLPPHAAHGHALGEEPHALQGDGAPGGQRRAQAGGLLVLDADDPHLRHEGLDEDGDARGEPPAAHGDEEAVELGVLLDDLQADGALAGDDARVVEGGDEGAALGLGDALGLGLGGVEIVPEEQDPPAQVAHGVDLDARGDGGHDDGGVDAQQRGGAGDALGVVAGGGGDDAAGAY